MYLQSALKINSYCGDLKNYDNQTKCTFVKAKFQIQATLLHAFNEDATISSDLMVRKSLKVLKRSVVPHSTSNSAQIFT